MHVSSMQVAEWSEFISTLQPLYTGDNRNTLFINNPYIPKYPLSTKHPAISTQPPSPLELFTGS